MVERKVCVFCGSEIEPGTGKMYVKKSGVIYNFCSGKCKKNMIDLRRTPRRIRWTKHYVKPTVSSSKTSVKESKEE